MKRLLLLLLLVAAVPVLQATLGCTLCTSLQRCASADSSDAATSTTADADEIATPQTATATTPNISKPSSLKPIVPSHRAFTFM